LRAYADLYAARPAGISFRVAAPEDTAFLCALYASTRREELAVVPWPDEAKQAFLAEQFAHQDRHYRANYPGADLLVVERDGVPIGRVYVYRSPGEIRLMDIALVDAEQGRGLGSALIAELMDEARATRASITLHVEPGNPARRWYERLGFTLLEDRGVYHFLGWTPEKGPE
jgi:ribosomal protein S18 acetylase RimI-like enzyme